MQEEEILGICGESLIAVGNGEVVLKCKTLSGVETVSLTKVRHAPRTRAKLFALSRATDAGARVVRQARTAQVMTDGVFRMEAVEREGLWEIETVGQRAFLARGSGRAGTGKSLQQRGVRSTYFSQNRR